MDSIDRAIAEALKRQSESTFEGSPVGCVSPDPSAGRLSRVAESVTVQNVVPKPVDPYSPEAILRAANEDDDLYDPYSDYMDALARSNYEAPEADPWR